MAAIAIGTKVTVANSKYWPDNVFPGHWFVVAAFVGCHGGCCNDYGLARHPDDDPEIFVYVTRIVVEAPNGS